MAKLTPDTVKTYHTLTIWWADKIAKGEKMVLTNEGCQLTYKVKDSAIHVEWHEFHPQKPAYIVRRMTIPLYNVKYIDEIIEDEEQGDESDD